MKNPASAYSRLFKQKAKANTPNPINCARRVYLITNLFENGQTPNLPAGQILQKEELKELKPVDSPNPWSLFQIELQP